MNKSLNTIEFLRSSESYLWGLECILINQQFKPLGRIAILKQKFIYPALFLWMGTKELFRPAGIWGSGTIVSMFFMLTFYRFFPNVDLIPEIDIPSHNILMFFAAVFALIAFCSLPSSSASAHLSDYEILEAEKLANRFDLRDQLSFHTKFLERSEKASMSRCRSWLGFNAVLLILIGWMSQTQQPSSFDQELMKFLAYTFIVVATVVGAYARALNKQYLLAFLPIASME